MCIEKAKIQSDDALRAAWLEAAEQLIAAGSAEETRLLVLIDPHNRSTEISRKESTTELVT